jgi:[acyl-carrier-protein] S-malonyltransferase
VERGVALARSKGAKRAVMLHVSVPSHCTLMRGAAEVLARHLEEVAFQRPRIPVLQNADVAAFDSPEAIRAALVRQLFSPVRWVETIQRMAAEGVTLAAECGPGKVLAGLNKRIDPEMACLALVDPASLADAISKVKQ